MTRTIQPPNVTTQEFDRPIIVERHMHSEQYATRFGLGHTAKVSGVVVMRGLPPKRFPALATSGRSPRPYALYGRITWVQALFEDSVDFEVAFNLWERTNERLHSVLSTSKT